jgi:tetratricopeptide (TPR) repeat protein
MRRPLRIVAFSLLLLGTATLSYGTAHADEKDDRALELFEKSEAAYDHGRFGDAIALLQQAYALKKEPVLLYNMGRAYEGLGDLRAAAEAYESFLAAEPHAPDRGALEIRIATMRRQLVEREELQRQAERDRNERERAKAAPPKRASAVPWIVASVGAAGVGTGVVCFALSRSSHDKAVAEPTYLQASRFQSRAETWSTVANVAWVAGGVVLAVGIVWGILDLSAASKSSRAAFSVPLAYSF